MVYWRNPFNRTGVVINPQTVQELGLNLGREGYSDYANQHVDFGPTLSFYTGSASGATFNSLGEPLTGLTTLTWFPRPGVAYAEGDYDLTWDGGGTINGNSSPMTVNVTGATNSINFNCNGQITNLSFRRQGVSGTYTSTATSRLTPCRAIRAMQQHRTVEPESEWNADEYLRRTLNATNTRHYRLPSPERLADLAMATQSDLWLCTHHLMSDAQIQDMVTRVSNSGYNRRLILERSNEVWNGDWQGTHNHALNQANLASPAYGGGDAHNRMAWHADETDRIGALAKAIYANTYVVLGSQLAVPAYGQTASPTLGLALVKTTGLPNVDGITVGGYVGQAWVNATPAATISAATDADIEAGVAGDYTSNIKPLMDQWGVHAANYSKDLLIYEGGFSLIKSDPTAQQRLLDWQETANAANVYATLFDNWDTDQGTLFMLYQGPGSPTDQFANWHGELGAAKLPTQEFLNRLSP